MPASQVFSKFRRGALHSGGKSGPVVKKRSQMLAIYESEKKNEDETGSADRKPRLKITRTKR
jgi:hypothetical protein